jgi:hypothetical protein
MKLRPVTYTLDVNSLNQFLGLPDSMQVNPDASTQVRTGFLAQEVEQAAIETDFDFSGIDKPANDQDHYALRYAEFVVPLVKAVQEQQEQIEALKVELESLKAKNAEQTEGN